MKVDCREDGLRHVCSRRFVWLCCWACDSCSAIRAAAVFRLDDLLHEDAVLRRRVLCC